MKHAFLIMAHNEPAVLRTLLAMLDDPRNDVYLHIDRRADALRPGEDYCSYPLSRTFSVGVNFNL